MQIYPPDILGGTPESSRVQAMFDFLKDGETLEDFLAGFPTVTREAAVAALDAEAILEEP